MSLRSYHSSYYTDSGIRVISLDRNEIHMLKLTILTVGTFLRVNVSSLRLKIIKAESDDYIVYYRPISRQHPKYTHATIEKVLGEVFSMWFAPCPLLGNRSINTHSDNRRGVCMWPASCPVLGNGPMNTHDDT
jgi:hypothetical protein